MRMGSWLFGGRGGGGSGFIFSLELYGVHHPPLLPCLLILRKASEGLEAHMSLHEGLSVSYYKVLCGWLEREIH